MLSGHVINDVILMTLIQSLFLYLYLPTYEYLTLRFTLTKIHELVPDPLLAHVYSRLNLKNPEY